MLGTWYEKMRGSKTRRTVRQSFKWCNQQGLFFLKQNDPILSDGVVFVFNGRISGKGYIYLSLYSKMRKRQYGKIWQTQFVPLGRVEVQRIV